MSEAAGHGVKQRVPWPIKFGIKLLLGVAGVDYRRLKRLRIVEHGRMEDPAFAAEIFEEHVLGPARRWHVEPGGRLLEIGPGDSVATGALGRARGYSSVALVDAGSFADLRPEPVQRLFAALGGGELDLRSDAAPVEVLTRLEERGVAYLTQGVRSLAAIDTSSVRYSFSNTVLQHVHRAELPQLIAELGRVHEPGSFSSHSVNLTDHFSGGFLQHRFPERFMESALVKRANLYTNRVLPEHYVELFEAAGFAIRNLAVDYLDPDARRRSEYHSAGDFRRNGGRPMLRAVFFLQKR